MSANAASYWEIPADSTFLESVPAERALWFETEMDRTRRYAMEEFYQSVLPVVDEFIENKLTRRQREVVRLYFFAGKTQEDIAELLELSQSTVSRHLFGTTRDGKKVGGAVPKLRKIVERNANPRIQAALGALQQRFRESALAEA